ncbi:MAG: zf-HC2 domain-containing protein [Candidatus Auribacterota bacterium]
MNCSLCASLLSDYIDNQLTDKQSRDIKTHLAQCPECLRQHNDLQKLVSALGKLNQHEPADEALRQFHKSLKTKPRKKAVVTLRSFVPMLSAAAMLVFVVYITMSTGVFTKPAEKIAQNEQENETIKEVTQVVMTDVIDKEEPEAMKASPTPIDNDTTPSVPTNKTQDVQIAHKTVPTETHQFPEFDNSAPVEMGLIINRKLPEAELASLSPQTPPKFDTVYHDDGTVSYEYTEQAPETKIISRMDYFIHIHKQIAEKITDAGGKVLNFNQSNQVYMLVAVPYNSLDTFISALEKEYNLQKILPFDAKETDKLDANNDKFITLRINLNDTK